MTSAVARPSAEGVAAGRPAGPPLLIVNADDYGLTSRVSEAIIRAHLHGVVTSTSILAVGHDFDRTVRSLHEAPTLGTGAHLAAVGDDQPVLTGREIPTLVDRRGRLARSWRKFVPLLAAGRIDLDDLRREFQAQIDVIRLAGVDIDHLDTHQNLHLWPSIADIVVELALKNDIGAVRVVRTRGRGAKGLAARPFKNVIETRCVRGGVASPEASAGFDEGGRLDIAAMVEALSHFHEAGARSAELVVHPRSHHGDPNARGRRWGPETHEYRALTSATVRSAIADFGFGLGTYADLVDSSGADDDGIATADIIDLRDDPPPPSAPLAENLAENLGKNVNMSA